MEDILLAITQLKQELDAINEGLHTFIRETMDYESQILKASEDVNNLKDEEEGCHVATVLQEARLQSMDIVAEKSRGYVMQEEIDIECIEEAVKESILKTGNNREDFMQFCRSFEEDVKNIAAERQSVSKKKKTLNEEIAKQSVLLEATEASKHTIIDEKAQFNQQLLCTNQGLFTQLQDCIVKNEKIIEEIENHNKSLRELDASRVQMAREIEENEDAIRQLKDLVMGLQIQISSLMDQS